MSVISKSQTNAIATNKKRWECLVPETAGEQHATRWAYAVRQNLLHGPPELFEVFVSRLGDLHHGSLSCEQVPDGNEGRKWSFLYKLANAYERPEGVKVGGKSKKSQKIVKNLSLEPTDDGRGAKFSWDSPLLTAALDMLEQLLAPFPGEKELILPQLRGERPPLALQMKLLHDVLSREGDLFKSAVSGVVTHVPTKDDQDRRICVMPDCDEENGLVLEENVDKPDDIAVLPGTRPCVKVGDKVSPGQSVLVPCKDELSALSPTGLATLYDYVLLCEGSEAAKHFVPEYPGTAGSYEDVADLCDENGVPIIQVGESEDGIFWGSMMLDMSGVRYDFERTFTCPPSPKGFRREQKRQEKRGTPQYPSKLFTPAS